MDEDLHITGFADAVTTVLGLQQTFRQGHTAVALRGDAVVDLTMFAGEGHTMDSALSWAACLVINEPGVDRLVLVSVGTKPVDEIREWDLDMLRTVRRAFAEHAVDVVDWIQSDGENLRSLAITAGWDTWSGRAPASPDGLPPPP